MAPCEHPTFFLYSQGLPVGLMKLGTLVYGNIADPEHRCAIYEGPIDENATFEQDVSGTWVSQATSRNGMGMQEIPELASISLEFARSKTTIVWAKEGRRVTLKDPHQFFVDNILQSEKTQARLRLWLTVAKSAYLLRKATFRRPKVYCVTGFYELTGARARSNIGKSNSVLARVGAGMETLTGGVPVGISIGPFENGQSLECDTYMKGTNVWAARFHQLDVEYIQKSIGGDLPASPGTIPLLQDRSRTGDMIMSGEEIQGSDSTALSDQDIQEANAVNVGLCQEIDDKADSGPVDDSEYWELFNRAEKRLDR